MQRAELASPDAVLDSMTTTMTPGKAMSDLEREIALLIVETLGLELEADAIAPDAALYGDALGLDSIDMLEIATVLSQRYGVEIRSGDAATEQIFASLRALTDYVARNRST